MEQEQDVVKNQYQEFNNFQISFYTNIEKFENYSNYDCKKHGYVLINNMAKGFPNLADIISNLKGLNWTGTQSPALLKALQRRFVNRFVNVRVPNFVYFKNLKTEKSTEKIKVSKKSNKLYDFDIDIQKQICSLLMIDSKTYDALKYTEKIQFLGKQINGEFVQQQKIKKSKKKTII